MGWPLRLTVTRRTLLNGEVLEAGAVLVFTPGEDSATVTRRVACTRESLRDLLDAGALKNVDGSTHEAAVRLGPASGSRGGRVLPIAPRLRWPSR